jgi:hypothetical protein
MSITSQEFHGLARGKMRGKIKTTKPSVKAPKAKLIKMKLQEPGQYPPDYPQRRSAI